PNNAARPSTVGRGLRAPAASFPETPRMWTVLLLIGSNAFMTIAWYGHLRFRGFPLWAVIVVSWLIALPEYALQVPANRIGYAYLSATQLKIIQEAISVAAFVVFGYVYLKEV